jgi:chromosome partitioning protein
MKTVLVANPKGGCGKTTLSINLAGYFARQGLRVVLSDLDRQQSSLRWLERRAPELPAIYPWNGRSGVDHRLRFAPDWIVMDGPAGMRGERLKTAIGHVDRVLVPVQASPLDTEVSADFLELLRALKAVRKERARVALVGNRVDRRARATDQLGEFLRETGLPVLTSLRETQLYVRTALEGSTIFDLPRYLARRDRVEWAPLIAWLEQ